MSREAPTPTNVLYNHIVFCAASKGGMLNKDTNKLTTLAFLRFRGKDQAAKVLNRITAIGSLHTGKIRDLDLGLDVKQDEPCHGFIEGLPFVEEDHELAELIATQLVELSRVCWRKP